MERKQKVLKVICISRCYYGFLLRLLHRKFKGQISLFLIVASQYKFSTVTPMNPAQIGETSAISAVNVPTSWT